MSKKYAIVQILGRQFKVSEGDKVKVSLMPGDTGAALSFSDVLLVNSGSSVQLGAPFVKGAKVGATITAHTRDPKVLVFKYLRKNKAKKLYGHKQPYTILTVNSISV